MRNNHGKKMIRTPFSVFVSFPTGGEKGIRTLDTFMGYTRFPIVRLRPAQPSLQVSDSVLRHPMPSGSNQCRRTGSARPQGVKGLGCGGLGQGVRIAKPADPPKDARLLYNISREFASVFSVLRENFGPGAKEFSRRIKNLPRIRMDSPSAGLGEA